MSLPIAIALAQINPIIGDLKGNSKKIITFYKKALSQGADLVVFPEMALTGYPPKDLLLDAQFIEDVEKAFDSLLPFFVEKAVVIGLPIHSQEGEKKRYNSAAIIQDGHLTEYYHKQLLPTYDVFDERRYFDPGPKSCVFDVAGCRVGVTICEDMWHHAKGVKETDYVIDPVRELCCQNIDVLVNLSASPYRFNKKQERHHVAAAASQTLDVPVVFVNQVGANDSLIFDGASFVMNQHQEILLRLKSFEEDLAVFSTQEPCKSDGAFSDIEEVICALKLGVQDYFSKQGFKKACIGVSGGIDSAVVYAIACDALGACNVKAFFMPSEYTSKLSYELASKLCYNYGQKIEELSIQSPFQSLKQQLINSQPILKSVTEQNLQARLRGLLLMAFANNENALLLACGNKSELALGYTTLYGDMNGALMVLGDLTKTRVYEIARHLNKDIERLPLALLTRPPTAELAHNQYDEDVIPPYNAVDQVIEHCIENNGLDQSIIGKEGNMLSKQFVDDIMTKIHQNEYKRFQAPLILRVTSKSFGVGRDMPIVHRFLPSYKTTS